MYITMERKVYKFQRALSGAAGGSTLSPSVSLHVIGQTERC